MYKKGIGPVVAISLLIVVSVISVVAFQSWFNIYSSETFVKIEGDTSNSITTSNIESIIGESLYFKNSDSGNITILSVKIDDFDCNISGNYTQGMKPLNISLCINNITTQTPNIVVVTSDKIYQKKVYLDDDFFLSLSSSSSSPNYDSILGGHLWLSNGDDVHYLPTSQWNGTSTNITVISNNVANNLVSGNKTLNFINGMDFGVYVSHGCWAGDTSELKITFLNSLGQEDGYLRFYYTSNYNGNYLLVKNGTTIISSNDHFGSYSGKLSGNLILKDNTIEFVPNSYDYGITYRLNDYNFENVSSLLIEGSARTVDTSNNCNAASTIKLNSINDPFDLTIPTTNLLAEYFFENNLSDGSGNGWDGIGYGGVSYISGLKGTQALQTDGDDDEIRVTEYNTLFAGSNKYLTISAWLYHNFTYYSTLVMGGDSTWVQNKKRIYISNYLDSNNETVVTFGVGQHGAPDTYAKIIHNTTQSFLGWNHVVLFADVNSNRIHAFFNNEYLGSHFDSDFTTTGSLMGFQRSLTYDSTPSRFYPVIMDNYRIYNRPLSLEEINALYQEGVS